MTNIIEQSVFVTVNMNAWSGSATMDASDIQLGDGGKLPPAELAKLGSKSIFPKQDLRAYNRIRTAITRYIRQKGVQMTPNCYLIPIEEQDAVDEYLKKAQQEFTDELNKLLNQYDDRLMSYLQTIKDQVFRAKVKDATLSANEVRSRFKFTYLLYQLKEGSTGGDVDSELQGLVGRTFSEVAKDVAAWWDRTLNAGEPGKLTQKSLNVLRDVRSKMHGLRYMDSSIGEAVDVIDQVFNALPNKGTLTKPQSAIIVGVAAILRNPRLAASIKDNMSALQTMLQGLGAQLPLERPKPQKIVSAQGDPVFAPAALATSEKQVVTTVVGADQAEIVVAEFGDIDLTGFGDVGDDKDCPIPDIPEVVVPQPATIISKKEGPINWGF
jgi:hypothetical protein